MVDYISAKTKFSAWSEISAKTKFRKHSMHSKYGEGIVYAENMEKAE
jgi:hypothetical protein